MNTYRSATALFQVFVLAMLCHILTAQEFRNNDSKYMYDASTMSRLRHIADSLNLKYRQCDLTKTYYSKSQTWGHFVFLEGSKAKQAANDIEKNITWADFVKKYPDASVSQEVLIYKYADSDYDKPKEQYVVVDALDFEVNTSIAIKDKIIQDFNPKAATWVANYVSKKDSYDNKAYIKAYYILQPFESKPLSKEYARMVQYGNCMIDTTTDIMVEHKLGFENFGRWGNIKQVSDFLSYAENLPNLPKKPLYKDFNKDDDSLAWEKYNKASEEWDSLHTLKLQKEWAHTPDFQQKLVAACQAALDSGHSENDFEWYVEKFLSPAKALQLKRQRRVMGQCSMDTEPRRHAKRIAELAAQTAQWEVFLRSHLDIMNDRFERTAYSSYGEATFETYMRELEALNIDMQQLVLGIALRINNPSSHHYYGSIQRLGRGLAEASNIAQTRDKLLVMVQDQNLDMYNRMICTYLYLNYNSYVRDKTLFQDNLNLLSKAVSSFPKNLQQRYKQLKTEQEE